jgi:hypothetical protein
MANAALKRKAARQYVLAAQLTVDFSNVVDTAVAVNAIDLPYGAQVVGGDVIVDTAFNAGTSIVLDIGDATVANRYVNDVNLAATGRTALVPTGYVSDGAVISITPVIVGAVPTAGSARITVQYVIKDRAQEAQTN